MAEAALYRASSPRTYKWTAVAAYSAGEILQLPNGEAGIIAGLQAIAIGEPAVAIVEGQHTLAKTASVVILKGAPLYWDRSANTVTPLKADAGGDFFAGTAVDDAVAAATTVVVELNVKPHYTIDLLRDSLDSVAVGDAVLKTEGGHLKFNILATSEAEKIDAMSVHSVPVTVPFIIEGRMASYVIGTDNTVDQNVGLANDTHATDADSITESLFLHLDEVLSINAESDDGTTEVSADTLVDCVDNTYFDFAFDCRDLTDIQVYINGVNVLPASVFALGDATGPLKLLAHVEKTTGTATGEMRVSKLALRTMDLAT